MNGNLFETIIILAIGGLIGAAVLLFTDVKRSQPGKLGNLRRALTKWWLIPALIIVAGIALTIEGLHMLESDPADYIAITTAYELHDSLGEVVRVQIDNNIVDTGFTVSMYEDELSRRTAPLVRSPAPRWNLYVVEIGDALVPVRVADGFGLHTPAYIQGRVLQTSDDYIIQHLLRGFDGSPFSFSDYSIRAGVLAPAEAAESSFYTGIGLLLIGIISIPILLLWRALRKRFKKHR